MSNRLSLGIVYLIDLPLYVVSHSPINCNHYTLTREKLIIIKTFNLILCCVSCYSSVTVKHTRLTSQNFPVIPALNTSTNMVRKGHIT